MYIPLFQVRRYVETSNKMVKVDFKKNPNKQFIVTKRCPSEICSKSYRAVTHWGI